MKKILILIVSIAIFLHFKPQPQIEQWYEQQKSSFLDKMAKSTVVTSKVNTHKLFEEFKREFIGFSNTEIESLKIISESTESVTDFYKNHCTSGKPLSRLFHPDNEDKVCRKLTTFIKGL